MWEEAHLEGIIENRDNCGTLCQYQGNMSDEQVKLLCVLYPAFSVYITKYLVKYIIYNTNIYISTM